MTTTALLILGYLACGVAAYLAQRAHFRPHGWTTADRARAALFAALIPPFALAGALLMLLCDVDWNKPARW
jgi:hypothetical protein